MFNEASVETAQVVATNAIYWTRNNRCVLAFDQKGRELLFKLTAYTFSEKYTNFNTEFLFFSSSSHWCNVPTATKPTSQL